MATLLLPAGVTSECSIRYKDEDRLLCEADPAEIDRIYIEEVLPKKMKMNLESIRRFSLLQEWMVMARTLLAVLS